MEKKLINCQTCTTNPFHHFPCSHSLCYKCYIKNILLSIPQLKTLNTIIPIQCPCVLSKHNYNINTINETLSQSTNFSLCQKHTKICIDHCNNCNKSLCPQCSLYHSFKCPNYQSSTKEQYNYIDYSQLEHNIQKSQILSKDNIHYKKENSIQLIDSIINNLIMIKDNIYKYFNSINHINHIYFSFIMQIFNHWKTLHQYGYIDDAFPNFSLIQCKFNNNYINEIEQLNNQIKSEINIINEMINVNNSGISYCFTYIPSYSSKSIFSIKLKSFFSLRSSALIELNDGKFLSGDYNGKLCLLEYIDSYGGELQVKDLPSYHQSAITSLLQLEHSANKGDIISSDEKGVLVLWCINKEGNYIVKSSTSFHMQKIISLLEMKNGKICSCSEDANVKVWSIEDGTFNNTLSFSTKGYVSSLCNFSNASVIFSTVRGNLYIWDTETNKCNSFKANHSSRVNSLSTLSNGLLLSCSDDGLIKIWEYDNEECNFDERMTIWPLNELLDKGQGKGKSNENGEQRIIAVKHLIDNKIIALSENEVHIFKINEDGSERIKAIDIKEKIKCNEEDSMNLSMCMMKNGLIAIGRNDSISIWQ